MIVLEHITASFGKRIILDDISAEFKSGTITAITGKSGAGKTTLLGIISGLHRPNKGKVLFKGKNILRWGDIRRSYYRNRHIGFIFQFFNLLSDMTSYQNIIYPARINIFKSREDIDTMAHELVEILGIKEIINHHPGTLSGGERQRVAIARAIINRPAIILADEPTGNLDDLSARGTIALFHRLRDEYGMCIIVVTHDSRMVEMSDDHYHLANGVFTHMKKGKTTKVSLAKIKKSAAKTAGKKKIRKVSPSKKVKPVKKKSGVIFKGRR
jgi:lipoprotein-releasing system ATP-binding protein